MIEERGLPLNGVMALLAFVLALAELAGVRILMALVATNGRLGKVYVQHGAFHVGRLVTIDAGHGAVRSVQSKLRRRMIELRQIMPVLGDVARLAAERPVQRRQGSHAGRKLTVMNIFVAGDAAEVAEVIERHRRAGHRLMAIVASGSDVAAG